jgi:hypothetical protein
VFNFGLKVCTTLCAPACNGACEAPYELVFGRLKTLHIRTLNTSTNKFNGLLYDQFYIIELAEPVDYDLS